MWIDDNILAACSSPVQLVAFRPKSVHVVLGSANVAERELNIAACQMDNVEIMRRYGGGGAVVLHPGCIVVSIGVWVRHHFRNDHYFRKFNDFVASQIGRVCRVNVAQAGISDLIVGDRKVAGTSLFRSRNYALYQASILVDAQVDLIERYLAHPSKEPDYRAGRTHRQFVAGLSELTDIPLEYEALIAALSEVAALREILGDELTEVQLEQLPALQQRLTRSLDGNT